MNCVLCYWLRLVAKIQFSVQLTELNLYKQFRQLYLRCPILNGVDFDDFDKYII